MKMAAAKALILIATSLLLGSTTAYQASKTVHVSGKVVCQDCTKSYSEWIRGARPIQGCRVSLTCTDNRGKVMLYDSDETDSLGEFNIVVSKLRGNGRELNERRCKVRVVYSPDPTCNILTDFGSGKSGVFLRRPMSVYRDLVKYKVGPFYSTTPMCDRPDTSLQSKEGSSGYSHP